MTIGNEQHKLIERYRQLRGVSRNLHSKLLSQVARETFTTCGKKLGFVVNGSLVFENEEESHVLMDYCIYDGWNGEHNAVTRYLTQQSYPPGSDEMLVLQAMSRARYSLLQVQSVAPGVGVSCLDILRGDGSSIIDEGLGATAHVGMVLATRLVTLPEFAMTTGAALPVDADALEAIRDVLEGGPVGVGKVDYNRLSRQQEAVMSAAIICCALSGGASSRVSHERPVGAVSAPERVHRNAPCPCGSGKKYKKCCGKI